MSDLEMSNKSTHLYNMLRAAILRRDRKTVHGILKAGFNVNTFPAEKASPLTSAVFSDDLEMVELLLSGGADPNTTKCCALEYAFKGTEDIILAVLKHCSNLDVMICDNATPLHHAVWKGQLNVVRYLLENGADPNLQTSARKKTALQIICEDKLQRQENKVNIAKMLLEHGADINQTDDQGNGPLIQAAFRGNWEIGMLLIEHGADIRARNSQGFTVLHRLLDKNFIEEETMQLFLDSGIDVDDQSNDRSCLLLSAAANPCPEPFQYLLKVGADISNLLSGNKSLLIACHKGHVETVKILLESGVNIYINSKEQYTEQTALHKAVSNANCATEIVQLLLNYGADVNLKDETGSTPLLKASELSNVEVVKLLLIHDATVNIEDKDGITPLHQACGEYHEEVISELLYYGADINAKVMDPEEETPLNSLIGLLPNKHRGIRIFRIFMAHMTLKIFQKQFIDPINIALVNRKEVLKDLMNKCLKEIEKMREKKIGSTSVSFYDFVTKSKEVLPKLVGNKDIQDGFESEFNLKVEFPFYEWFLTRKYTDALDRLKIIEEVNEIFFKNINSLPQICLDKIFNFLSFRDLQNILQSTHP